MPALDVVEPERPQLHIHPDAPCCTIATMVPWKKARAARLRGMVILPTILLAATLSATAASPAAKPVADAVHPSARIPVEPLGFVPPARFFMPYRVPAATLDFLDATHLLFTFHVARLMRREPDDPAEDQDQTIRALVLSLPAGRIESEGTWRLHDRERYLWMLPQGRFLMRQRDTLYLGDKTLSLSIYLHPEGHLASVQLSPDAGTMAVQFAKPAQEDSDEGERAANAPTLGGDAPRFPDKPQQYTLLVVDTRGRVASRMGRLQRAVVLPMVEGGYLGVQPDKAKQWNILVSPFKGDPRIVANVTSACQPVVQPISQSAFLAKSCLPFSPDHLVDAFDLEGHKLWEQVWQSRFTWGTYAYSASGNRFAYGSIEVDHSLSALDPVDESSILGEPVGVFDVKTGKTDTVLDATPILTAGENFALSPDGDKLAILRGGAIEVYDLPPAAAPAATSASNGVRP